MKTAKPPRNRSGKVNLNRRNCSGETFLVKSIIHGRSNFFIISLIESGWDVNISTKNGQSPLHLATSFRRTAKVASELIKAGANINALDAREETPLHYAVRNRKLEMVDMLLYYGADVSIWSSYYNGTPLMWAAEYQNLEIFQTLMRHYDENSCISITQQNEDCIVECFGSIIHPKPIWTACEDTFFLGLSMYCGFPELFQLIWKRLDHGKLLVGNRPFLVTYWKSKLPSFTTSNWLDCLNLILSSSRAFKFVDQCNKYQQLYFPTLIQAFDKHGVNKKDRLAILYSLFSLGAEVCCSDIDWIRQHYGFNEEFEACIYAGNYRGRISDVDCDSPFLTFIFGLEQECSVEKVFELFQHWPPNLCHYYRFFSLSPDMKRELQEAWNKSCRFDQILNIFGKASMFYTADIAKELSQMSEVPSLLELSRNAAQSCIRKSYGGKILKPYEFHDVVKGLRLPKNLQEVLIFTRPIYHKNCNCNS